MDTIKVLLVDDQILFVESLKTVLETRTKDIKVIGIAHDGREAVQKVEKEHPHIVLMDVRMPNMDGVEATRVIKNKFPETHVMMLTTFDDDDFVHDALYHGAVGYLLKDIPPDELITAMRAVNEGAVLISQTVAAKLVQQFYRPGKRKGDHSKNITQTPPWLSSLSKREKEVLSLLSRGLNNKEIAEHMFIAEQTVKNHVSIIYSKIGVQERIKAMKMGIEANLNN
ncbi:Transcriptional regulatory protein LnrK [subsurface metagenome]